MKIMYAWYRQHADEIRSVLLLAGLAAIAAQHLGSLDIRNSMVSRILADVTNISANSVTNRRAFQNYYGELLGEAPRGVNTVSLESPFDGQAEMIQFSGATRPTENHLRWELIPNVRVMFKGVPLEVNEWGQRDRTGYSLDKPEDTFRICIVGDSNTMGYGVREEDSFANLIEVRLNGELGGEGYGRYEVINFSVGGYQLHERLYVVEHKVRPFQPDLILVSAAEQDLTTQYLRLARMIHTHQPIEFRFLRQIIKEAGCDPGRDSLPRLERKLEPFARRIILGCLRELADFAARNDLDVAIFLLRRVGGERLDQELVATLDILRESDITILPVFKAYEGVGEMDLWLQPSLDPGQADAHPNVEGHRRIADNLYDLLMADSVIGRRVRGR